MKQIIKDILENKIRYYEDKLSQKNSPWEMLEINASMRELRILLAEIMVMEKSERLQNEADHNATKI